MKGIKLNSYVLPAYILMLIPPIVVVPLLLKYILLFLGLLVGVKILKCKISTKRIIGITNKNFLVCVFIDFILYIVVYGLSVFLPHYRWVQPLEEQIMLNPFSSFTLGICYVIGLLVAGVLEYLWIRKQLVKSGFSRLVYNKVAIVVALVSAPYIIMVPKKVIETLLFIS